MGEPVTSTHCAPEATTKHCPIASNRLKCYTLFRMGYSVTQEDFDNLATYWSDARHNLRWDLIFVLPGWLRVWWQTFGAGAELNLCAVKQGGEIIGIAPLLTKNKTASLIGSDDVCDYLDFITAPDMERDFFSVLLDDLRQKGINRLELNRLSSAH